jgi:copper transport protein
VKKLFLFVAVVVGFVALTALPAFAHAALEETSPTDGQTFPAGQPPKSVTLQFSEGVQVSKDGVRVLASSGNALKGTGEPTHGATSSTVTMTLPAKMADGTYVVDWRVVSADSHPVNGAFTFTVGKATASASDVAGLLKNHNNRGVGIAFGLTRALAFGSVLALLGGIVFIRVCSSDAGDDQGVRSLLWICWAVAFVTSFVGIGMQAAYTTGQDISGMWNSTALGNVLDERFGQSWLLRAGLLLLVLPALYKPSRKRAPVANVVDAIVALFVLSTFTFAEHARTGRWVPLATVTDLVHLSSAAVWLGGVAVLATLLTRRVVPRDTPEVTQRFSRIAAPAIVIIAISGAVQALRQTDGLNSVFDTTYGRLLLTKIGLVVMIVAAASVSRHIVRLWVNRQLLPAGPGAMRSEADPEDIRELRNAVVVEVAIAIIVLLVTAVLVNTAPARVESAAPGASGGSVTTPVQPAGYSATLSNAGIKFAIRISPGVSGTNQVTVATTKDGRPFDPIDITATLTQTAQNAKLAVPLTSEGKGTGTAQGNVDLPIAGKYRLEVRALYTDVDEAVVSDDVQIL